MSVVRIPSGPLSGVSLQVADRPLASRVRARLRGRRRGRRTRPVITTIVPVFEEPAPPRDPG